MSFRGCFTSAVATVSKTWHWLGSVSDFTVSVCDSRVYQLQVVTPSCFVGQDSRTYTCGTFNSVIALASFLLNIVDHAAAEGGPAADNVGDPNGAMLESDQAVEPPTEDQSAAEAAPEPPAIPAEIPAQVVLRRLADRSAVTAPSDAVGELLC